MREAAVAPTIRPMSADDRPAAGPGAGGPVLTVAVVARRLGVAPATLRTWDRRYGVGPTGHAAGAHRRYTPVDVQRLELMRRLTREGVLPAEAARVALAADSAPKAAETPNGESGSWRADPRAVPLHDTDAAVRGLVKAAQALDARSIDRTVTEALDTHGVMWTWDALVVPALTAIGDRWGTTGTGVDVEHLLAESILNALRTVGAWAPEPRNTRPVLLACAPEELHSLPLYALAAALLERGIDARVLGARVPPAALGAAVRRAGACAVFVWAHDSDLADTDQLAAVPPLRPSVALVVGGPGWGETPAAGPNVATRVERLSEAVMVLHRAALG
jgi:DNA-binding transcriptional MerR regulator